MKLESCVVKVDWDGHNFIKGWGCGYVALPLGHPLYGVSEVHLSELEVEGGITLSCHYENFPPDMLPKSFAGCWVIGFDTARPSLRDETFVREETEKLRRQLESVVGLKIVFKD